MRAALLKMSIVFLIATSTASCAGMAGDPAPVVSSACGWLTKAQPEAGFETRWTRGEKLFAVVLNRNIDRECPR